MRNIIQNTSIIFTLCVFLATAISCKKDSTIIEKIVHDTIFVQDTFRQFSANTGVYVRTFAAITATEKSTNKIVRVDGFQATTADAYSDCDAFKYTNYFRITSKYGNRLIINLSTPDSIVTLKCDNSSVIIDSLHYESKLAFSFLIRAAHDTIRDPKVTFTFQTKTNKLLSSSIDMVGEINNKCFGTCFWATRYFRILDRTLELPVSKAIEMDSNYIPKRGDIIYFDGGHLGNVYNTPTVITTTKAGKTTFQYDFNLYEMNAKCTSAFSYKVEHVLSTDITGTLFSYNVDRGEPLYYYRNL
jgi:hypothetical protein